ncbi:hypothetical protein COJ21_24315 [Priestia megaterium]|uniref:DUF3916 domain-containing protein n=1 Tax=Priestia megaterium TaxID=1404 RepID=UPI000BF2777C|nr:DUF3916 domain-containing protein [Priestia megaterium]PFK67194.1 hypothetical protein COJ21_24315 [Priestia megaterium]
MHRWKFDNGLKKKTRGIKRKCRTFVNSITEYTTSLPSPEDNSYLGYWHLHMPFNESFIDSKNTSNSVRKLCMQTMINRMQHLIDTRTELEKEYRIYILISLPKLFDSQIVVLFDKEDLNGFFDRNTEEQSWIPLPSERSIEKEWGLEIPENLVIKGYKETINDEDYFHEGELWFIGELA